MEFAEGQANLGVFDDGGVERCGAAHDFASAGLDVNDVANAVARDIGDLSALSQGVARGTVQMGQTTIAYSRNTLTTRETVVNFWIR